MENRPLLLRIFSLILILEPLIKLVTLSFQTEFAFLNVLDKSLSLSVLDFVRFWLVFPISGILILQVKLTPIIIYFVLQIYNLFFHITYETFTWPYLSKLPHISSVFMLILNIVIMLYILMPRTRKYIFNADLRWWERAKRYSMNESIFFVYHQQKFKGIMENLSETGALVAAPSSLQIGDEILTDFTVLDKSIQLRATIVREVYSTQNITGYGINFLFDSAYQKLFFRWMLFKSDIVGELVRYR